MADIEREMDYSITVISRNNRLNISQRENLRSLQINLNALWKVFRQECEARRAAEARVEELIAGIRESNNALDRLTGDLVDEPDQKVA